MSKIAQELKPTALINMIRDFEKSDAQKLKIAVGGVAGLYLILKKTMGGCSRRWVIRCKINGKAVDRSLYGLTYKPNGAACGLAEARAKAREYRASLLADTPMRPTPQSGTHGRRSWNRMLKTYQPRAVFGVGAFLCLLVIRLGNVKN